MDNFNTKFIPLKNYQIVASINNVSRSDGILIFIKNEITQTSTEIIIRNANFMLTLITYKNINYGIISI